MDILEQIRANYGSFSRPRQRISDFILNYPEQCCFLSLRSFAQQVGTTEVTVLNFCRGLGLGSYMDLKKALQDYLIVRVNAGDRLKLAVAGSGSAQDLPENRRSPAAEASSAACGELVPFPLLSHPRGPHANPVKRFAWGKGAAAEGVSFAACGEAKDLELAATLSRCGLGAWPGC